jgi:hypothetical protein
MPTDLFNLIALREIEQLVSLLSAVSGLESSSPLALTPFGIGGSFLAFRPTGIRGAATLSIVNFDGIERIPRIFI